MRGEACSSVHVIPHMLTLHDDFTMDAAAVGGYACFALVVQASYCTQYYWHVLSL